MASLNRVHLIGNLGQDPELRYTQNQTPVTSFSIATSEYRNAPDGTKQTITDWHRIVVWGRQAENCSKYLKKGRPVFIEGRLQTRTWEDQNGQKRSTTEVVASNIQFLGGAQGEQRTQAFESSSDGESSLKGSGNASSESTLDDVPF